jgi:hypothetical protein
MSAARQLLTRLEDLEIPHLAFTEQLASLRQRVELARAGYSSRIEWILGPSRVGKSKLIEVLARENPESRVGGKRRVPIVVASVPESVSPQHLPGCVIAGLGLPLSRGTVGTARNFMYAQLDNAGTQGIFFEEASHIVDIGTKVPPRAAGDFFKGLHDRKIALFMFGLPRLRRLRENEQVRGRSAVPREFHAYDSRIPAEATAFMACVQVYSKVFKEAGWPIEFGPGIMFSHCYLHTGGLVGYLFEFMRELAVQRIGDSPRSLTFADLQAAAARTESAGDPRWPAFRQMEIVAPAHLHRAHAQVLEDNLMSIRALSSDAGDSA